MFNLKYSIFVYDIIWEAFYEKKKNQSIFAIHTACVLYMLCVLFPKHSK